MGSFVLYLLVFQAIYLCVVFGASKTVIIDNTKPMLDTNGTIINVHEGHIVRWESNGLFYFYGMQYDLCPDADIKGGEGNCGWKTDHNISVYTSNDLSSGSWNYEGTIFDTTTPNRPYGTYFRMFIYYNEMNKNYVIWTRVVYNSSNPFYISMTSDHPLGPFKIVNTKIEMGHTGGSYGDFYGYKDESNGNAYMVYGTGGKIAVDLLTPDYTASTKNTTKEFNINSFQEAPLMFKRNDLFYVLTGHGCGVCLAGSDANVWISKNGALGSYEYINNIGAYENGTSRTQSQMAFFANIEQSNGESMYLWSGDRWRQAIDGLHGHDPQIWQPLVFKSDNSIENLKKISSFNITIDI